MWTELQRLRSLMDVEQQERRASSFMERMQVAQLRQQTELLRRSLLMPAPAAHNAGLGSLSSSPLSMEQHYLEQLRLNERLQNEKARHIGLATELRDFARNMQLDG